MLALTFEFYFFMSILLLFILIIALITLIAGIIKKNKSLILMGIVLGLIFAGLFYQLGQTLSTM